MNTKTFVAGDFSSEMAAEFRLSPAANMPQPEGEPLRHILLGSPAGIRQTIHLLHNLRYVETAQWSPLVAIPNNQLILTPRQGEVMSLLLRHLKPGDLS